jgi:hypothetical protein
VVELDEADAGAGILACDDGGVSAGRDFREQR